MNLKLSLEDEFKKIAENFKNKAGVDYAASRGEYLNGIIMANYLGYEFVDAAEVIFFDKEGNFDAEKTDKVLSKRLAKIERAVIPGFLRRKSGTEVSAHFREAVLISGSIVSRAVHATCYENWTDVSGFLIADPRIIDHPKRSRRSLYRELRELSYMGASVLHVRMRYSRSAKPVFQSISVTPMRRKMQEPGLLRVPVISRNTRSRVSPERKVLFLSILIRI